MEEPADVSCPWCGEVFTTFVDLSVAQQSYIEDCQVCCRPIVLAVETNQDTGEVSIHSDRS